MQGQEPQNGLWPQLQKLAQEGLARQFGLKIRSTSQLGEFAG